MRLVLIFFALIAFGVAFLAVTQMRSDIQLTVVVLAFGFGVTFVGLAAILHELIHHRR